jgi:SWI/SNF-related matrix-associated actin-dependent regulator 1 of chromatin subfamily A
MVIAYPNRWTAEVRYDAAGASALAAIYGLAELPGVAWSETRISLPISTWDLPQVDELREVLGLDPFHSVRWTAPPAAIGDLYPYQKVAVERILASEGLLLADQMGLGKTRTAAVAAESAARVIKPQGMRLVIGPLFTRDVWRRELLACGAIEDPSQFCALVGRDLAHPSFNNDALWYFCHYEILPTWLAKLTTSKRGKPYVVIVDECHWIRNGRTKRAAATTAAAGLASWRVLLTGTPLESSPADLWCPLSVLDGPRSWGAPLTFRVRYCGAVHNGYGYEDTGSTFTDELQARLNTRYLRRTVADVGLDLPPLRRQALAVDLSEAERTIHDEMCRGFDMTELVDAFVSGRVGPRALELLGKLRHLTSEAKLSTTVEYVRDLVVQGEHVVVFVHERVMAEKLGDLVGGVVVHGGHAIEERDACVAAFQSSPEARALVATYGALREGVTLHRARIVVHHDLDWVISTMLQSEARVYRIGQSRGVQAVWVTAQDSIDTLMAAALLGKARTIEAALGDSGPADALQSIGLPAAVGHKAIEDVVRDALTRWV